MAKLNGMDDLKVGIEHIECALSWLEEYEECQNEVQELHRIKENLKNLA